MKAGFRSSAADAGKGKGKVTKNNNNNNISHGSHLVKGKTNHPMEDYLVSDFKRVNEHDLGLFAIFDGHLGHDVANFLQNNLFHNILKEVLTKLFFPFSFHFTPFFFSSFFLNNY